MATTNTPTTLASRLKEVYADGPSSLVPNSTVLQKRLKFKAELVHGEKVRFDVQLSTENGISVGQGSVTLNGSVAQESAKAEVEGFSVVLQSRASYDLIERAKGDKKSFARFNDSKFIPMAESMQKRCEIYNMGYGRQGLGVVTANNSGVLTISPASWSSALWAGAKGTILQAFTATSGGSQHNGDVIISAVNIANKTITVTGTSAAIVANDILFLKGHRGAGVIGLTDIAVNTGTMYNISAATYELWAAQSFDVGTSALTLGKILEAAGQSADMGCDEKLTILVPIKTFQSLTADESTLRLYDNSYKKGKMENGAENLSFYGANGEVEVVPYRFIKDGEFMMFPERYTYRIGSTDVTANVAKDGDIVFDLEATSDKEMRLFADYTVFCERPAWIVRGTRSDGGALHS